MLEIFVRNARQQSLAVSTICSLTTQAIQPGDSGGDAQRKRGHLVSLQHLRAGRVCLNEFTLNCSKAFHKSREYANDDK
jgi:hypothetical protein